MRVSSRLMPLVLTFGLAACQVASDRDRYPVFFEPQSVTLSKPAEGIIAYAASDALRQHARHVRVIGRAGASHNLSADELRAMKRASTVAQALTRQGVDPRIIEQQARAPRNQVNAVAASRTVTIEIDP